jgi:hypothetical protein
MLARMAQRNLRGACTVTLVVVAALLACKKQPAEGKVGETIAQSDYRLTVLKVDQCPLNDAEQSIVGKGAIALGVEMVIERTGSKQVPHNPTYAEIKDSAGRLYKGSAMAYCKPALPLQVDVEPGKPLKGFVTFEMPATATGLKLAYSPYLRNDQEIRFDLGR